MASNRLHPFMATHPGTVLADELQERGISAKSFAETLSMAESELNDFLAGRRDVSVELARKIEDSLNIPARFWMQFQENYYEDLAYINGEKAKSIGELIRSYFGGKACEPKESSATLAPAF